MIPEVIRNSRQHSLQRYPSSDVVVDKLKIAGNWWTRFLGLQFKNTLPAGEGLLLVPCGSVHTFFMRFSIDVVMIDNAGEVLKVVQNMRPWRIALAPRKTKVIVEVAAGTATANVGDCLIISNLSSLPAKPRKLLSFLERDSLKNMDAQLDAKELHD